MHKFLFTITVLMVLMFSSCSKKDDLNCKLISGELKKETRTVEPYRNIMVEDNVNIVFRDSPEDIIEVEAGSALLSNIKTEVTEDGWLLLKNENGCDWARDYSVPVNVYLKTTNIDTIEYKSIGNISSIDTLRTEHLSILVMEGAGNISPDIKVKELFCKLIYGTSDIKLGGICDISYVYSASYGLVDLRNLRSSTVFVNSISTNDTYVYTSRRIGVEIFGLGNIYYLGDPIIIESNIYSQGQLIKLQ